MPEPTNFEDVGEFHHKFGLASVTHDSPGVEPKEVDPMLLEFRIKFLLEEFIEFVQGAGYYIGVSDRTNWMIQRQPHIERDHAQMFDALIDLVYVALGTAHLFGYPWQYGWNEVQRANMTKERATEETASERGGTFDVIKPEGWTPPDIREVLQNFGWEFPE